MGICGGGGGVGFACLPTAQHRRAIIHIPGACGRRGRAGVFVLGVEEISAHGRNNHIDWGIGWVYSCFAVCRRRMAILI